MSSPNSGKPNAGFQDRLNRVAERRAPHEAGRQPVDVLPDWKENASGPAGIVLAVLIGILAVLVVRLVRFHFTGQAMVTDSPDLTMALEAAGAMAISLVVFFMLPWRGFQYKLLQFGGVVLMITTMHNVVHSAPGVFRLAFSSDWTDIVLAETEPGSMYVRGTSMPFAGKIRGEEVAEAEVEPEAPKLPGRIKIGQ